MPTRFLQLLPFLLSVLLTWTCADAATDSPEKTVAKWQKVELDFRGPATHEQAELNPFTDYRLDVTFTHDSTSLTVPGFYAADGHAAETSADSGRIWRVRFRPPLEGRWRYQATFSQGPNVATLDEVPADAARELENNRGSLLVTAPKTGETGRLQRTHPRYLQWAESKRYFLKGGSDSPENLLAYADFDNTFRYQASDQYGESAATKDFLHRFPSHVAEWRSGDASWQGGKGKGIVGGLKYLASKGINSVYFLSMNINGDGKDVWPYTSHTERLRFDVSKLAQWEKVFDHADDRLGMMLHVVTGETENETLLDGGDTGPERRLYYRELVARFGHHRAVTWNLGEENGPNSWSEGGQTPAQVAEMAAWFRAHDPYQNYVSVHTHPNRKERREILAPLVGNRDLGGLAIQVHLPEEAHEVTKFWLDTTAAAPWIVTIDEIGPWYRGLDPDDRADLNNQDSVRALTLWGNLMAGGGGAEWYFGGRQPQNDLNAEDWHAYNRAWSWTGHALHFFQEHLSGFHEMEAMDELTDAGNFCLARPGAVYAVYLPFGGTATLDLVEQSNAYQLSWYNPREGGELVFGDVEEVVGGTIITLTPPGTGDWAALVEAK